MLIIRPVKKWAQLFCKDLSLLLFLRLIKQILGNCVSTCRRMDFCMTREADTGPLKVLPCVRFRASRFPWVSPRLIYPWSKAGVVLEERSLFDKPGFPESCQPGGGNKVP